MRTLARRPAAMRAEEGASAVEYALIVFAIAAVIVVVVLVFGKTIKHMYSNSCASVNTGGTTTVATGDCS